MKGGPVDIWYHYTNKARHNKKGLSDLHRDSLHSVLLYEKVHQSLTSHNLQDCLWALRILPAATTIDPFVTFRFFMIMIHTAEQEGPINKNVIIYLETLLSKLDLAKPDVFVEFLTYFISNNRIEDAREMYSQRHRFMSYLYHRKMPLIIENIGCYDLLFNYLSWKDRTPNQTMVKFDVSIQGWLVNAMGHLKGVRSNYELFVMCVVNVLLYYGFFKKAYLFLSAFQRSNEDNIAAQLLLYNLIKTMNELTPKRQRIDSIYYLSELNSEREESRKIARDKELEGINNFSMDECNVRLDLGRYPVISDKKRIFDNLRRLDQRREELFELSTNFTDRLEALQLVMDSLENVSEIRKESRWRLLYDILKQILATNDELLIEGLRNLWQTRYYPHWRLEDFLALSFDEFSNKKAKHRKIIKKVIRTLSSEFDPVKGTDSSEDEPDQCEFSPSDYYDIDGLDDSQHSPKQEDEH